MANTDLDRLTGLPVRQDFEGLFAEAVAKANGLPVSLAFVDIDFFERINEEFGRAGGDAALKAVAAGLLAIEGGKPLRYGGDEFAVLFGGIEREQAFLRLEKAREAVSSIADLDIGGKRVAAKLSISVGIAAFPIDGSNEAELMRKADGALYRAKLGGRNKVSLAYEEKMAPKTSHFTLTQLERLALLARDQGVGEAVLLREALDDLLVKYLHGFHKED